MLRGVYDIYTDTNQFSLVSTGERNVRTEDDVETFFYFKDGVTPAPFTVQCNGNSRVLIESAKLLVYGAAGLREGITGIVSPIEIIMKSISDITPEQKATFGIPLFKFNEWQTVNKEILPEWFNNLVGYIPKKLTVIAHYDALGIQDIYKEQNFSYKIVLRIRCAGIYKDGVLI